jgi:hypothetical protein
MKTISLIAMFLFSIYASGQTIQITGASASAVDGGINVSVQTISYNGAGYLSYDYAIDGNAIELSVCYYFNMLAPVLNFSNDFFIPIEAPGEYTVVVSVYNSASTETCDYYSLGGTTTLTVLDTPQFTAQKIGFYPNPAQDVINLDLQSDVSIFDMTGKLVIESNDVEKVDTNQLAQGIYLVRLESDRGTITRKLIKK